MHRDESRILAAPSPTLDAFIIMATKKLGTSLQAINAQIAALQAKADAIRKQEVGEVVAKIKEAIAHYGLTAADRRQACARCEVRRWPRPHLGWHG
jgi:DNA-binding protein H-NS